MMKIFFHIKVLQFFKEETVRGICAVYGGGRLLRRDEYRKLYWRRSLFVATDSMHPECRLIYERIIL